MPDVTFAPVTGEDAIRAVARLARTIWTEHYTRIIGEAQVRYMLERFQSEPAIASQLADGYEYFLLQFHPLPEPAGYLAVVPRGEALHLSKIYVARGQRGRGLGRKAVDFVLDLARDRKLNKITLTVNRHNTASIAAYRRIGFRDAGVAVADIGGGFVMDDLRLEMEVERP